MKNALSLLICFLVAGVSLCVASEEANRMSYEGIIAVQKGDTEKGLNLMKQATSFAPDDAYLHMNYGSMLFIKGQKTFQAGNDQEARVIFKEVEDELHTAINLFKETDNELISQCYFLLGDIYAYAYKDGYKAKQLYQKSLEYFPEHSGARQALEKLQSF